MFIDKFSVALSFQNLKNVDISILECEIYFNIFITFSTPDNLQSYIRRYNLQKKGAGLKGGFEIYQGQFVEMS